MDNLRRVLNFLSFTVLFIIITTLFVLSRHLLPYHSLDSDVFIRNNSSMVQHFSIRSTTSINETAVLRYLSYQPPGNGWNNQRIALEGALLLAKLLNRTLIVHPLSSHAAGEEMKKYMSSTRKFGHISYNKMELHNLLPLSYFLDLKRISKIVPLIEYNSTHVKFVKEYSDLRWHGVCHSVGFGYWVDRYPVNEQEKLIWSKQVFTPTPYWRGKCRVEMEEAKHKSGPIVKIISDLKDDDSEILYFEEGTLFGVQFRFFDISDALMAQKLILENVRYKESIYKRARSVKEKLGAYNSVHIRRVNHVGSKITQEEWITRFIDNDFLVDTPVYVATDEADLTWFKLISNAGFKLYFASDFQEMLNFTSNIHQSLRQDYLGIHEQVICELSSKFLPTEHSTFSVYVQRLRGEVESKDGLYIEGLHSFWMEHMTG